MKRCLTSPGKKTDFAIAFCALALLSVFLLSLALGQYEGFWKELSAGSQKAKTVLVHIRLVRTLGACLCGAALALSGAVIQILFQNPLASPGILGINAGAGFFQCLFLLLFPKWTSGSFAAAFIGALAVGLFCVLIAVKKEGSSITVVLFGVIVSQILAAGIDMLVQLDSEIVIGYAAFKTGSFSSLSMARLALGAFVILFSAICLIACARVLQILSLGGGHAQTSGVNVKLWMAVFLLLACLLAAGSVYLCGLLSFAGLVVPAVCRKLARESSRKYLILCALCGSLLVCFCDLLGRIILPPYEIAAGTLCALIGGPVFVWLLLHNNKGKKQNAGN